MSSPIASRTESSAFFSRFSACGSVSSGLLHHDRGLDVPPARLSSASAVVVVDAGDDAEDPPGAILQLLRAGLHVDHQVAVGLADLDHRDGGQHVEHHLGRGARP